MMGARRIPVIFALCVTAAVAGAGPAFAAGDPGILTVGMGSEARSLDPHFGGDSDLQRWMPNSYE
ncbi:MAG: hypothetical protein HY725_07005, partial [Candidatus Rokubacteria bacterium]|nr:hypothetical protein [Candidatus Rokubacteria bacterium]